MWIKDPPLNMDETVLLDFTHNGTQDSFILKWTDGRLTVDLGATGVSAQFRALNQYKYANAAKYQMVGFTFDGVNNRGTFFTDGKYGYNDGTVDHIVKQ